MAAGALASGCGTARALPGKGDMLWAGLFHMGTNMWCDQVPSAWGPYKGEDLKLVCAADHVRFDEKVWRAITGRMAEVGMNMVVIDLGEAIKYPSHPELWVNGSWEIDRFRKELDRLRSMGIEPIPKMNFSAAHDVWLKKYERMLSTRPYYQVCADLIRDVCEIFDHPRFLHLGYDEETVGHQSRYLYCTVRQGDLWWKDFLWFVKETERNGMRPWIWSDYGTIRSCSSAGCRRASCSPTGTMARSSILRSLRVPRACASRCTKISTRPASTRCPPDRTGATTSTSPAR